MDQNFEDFKQKVKDSSDIVEVISSYVSLQKRGRSYWACCPFHGEKTPSFSVNRDGQFFYCFGCHTGGDVFTFVEKMENIPFCRGAAAVGGESPYSRSGIPPHGGGYPSRQGPGRTVQS